MFKIGFFFWVRSWIIGLVLFFVGFMFLIVNFIVWELFRRVRC